MTTVAALLRVHEHDERPALFFDDEVFTYTEMVAGAAQRAALLSSLLDPGAPPHVGVLLDNVPEYPMWLAGAAFAGACVVGVNPTRRGADLARDVAHTRCQVLVTERSKLALLQGIGLGIPDTRILVVDDPSYADASGPFAGAPLPDVDPDSSARFLLLFTSGTTGAPKAVIVSQGRLWGISQKMVEMFSLTPDDVSYSVMPYFHGNALMTSWAPVVAGGGAVVLRRRFSASAFLPDIRRYGCTYFNYVGRTVQYILATPERSDDAANPLVKVFGNEAGWHEITAFERRFGCRVTDGYGMSEGGANISRVPGTPPAALGIGAPGTDLYVADPETGDERPRARFDANGRFLNPGEAIGELVNRGAAAGFEGYWDNPEASAARIRDGAYWTGDLVYRDDADFYYFAGRDQDWLRVDGENFSAAPVERILSRFEGLRSVAVYAVPDPVVGDVCMAALEMEPGVLFDPATFDSFLAGQSDLGTKMNPRLVRIVAGGAMPTTETNKLMRRALRRERWEVLDPLWWRPRTGDGLAEFTPSDRAEWHMAFAEHGRLQVLDAT